METGGSSMRITVKTVEWLRHHLPGDPADNQAEIEVAQDATDPADNQAEIEVAQDATPESVITQLALSSDHHYAVEVNGTLVPQSEHGSLGLAAGDVLTVLPEPKVGM
jgi:sulfur carrier protein ThiS